MSEENMHHLAKKWLEGTATEAEIKRLHEWYHDKEEAAVPMPDPTMEARIKKEISSFIAPKRSFAWAAIAASIMLLIAAWSLFRHPGKETNMVQVYVPREHRDHLRLPDSSEVWLNADSKLSYHEQNGKRTVTLEGEAFFSIKSAAGRPFIVEAGKTTITVLGTSFNIKAYKNDPKVLITVATGKVQVQDNRKAPAILTANKQITLEPITGEIKQKEVNAIVYKSWIDGKFEVNNESFEEIANRLSRKYNVTFHFEHPEMLQCTFLASFDSNATLPLILNMLCRINNSTYTISEDKKEIYISGNGCERN
jgi:ferric-dicitrate binding protein FerR (iron transport regulator)